MSAEFWITRLTSVVWSNGETISLNIKNLLFIYFNLFLCKTLVAFCVLHSFPFKISRFLERYFCPNMDLALEIKTIHQIKQWNPHEKTHKRELIPVYSPTLPSHPHKHHLERYSSS